MLFWIIAVVMVAAALAFVLPAFIVRHAPAGEAAIAGPRTAPWMVLVPAMLVPAFAFGLYAIHGDPGAIGTRPDVASFDGDHPQATPASREDLVRHLERNPRDGRGWVLLARLELGADRYADAAAAYANAIAANARIAADAAVWCEYADALGMAQGGTLAGKPREMVLRALALDPALPTALEMAGGAAFEAQEYAAAARYWRDLLAQMAAPSQARVELEAAIVRADVLALRR